MRGVAVGAADDVEFGEEHPGVEKNHFPPGVAVREPCDERKEREA